MSLSVSNGSDVFSRVVNQPVWGAARAGKPRPLSSRRRFAAGTGESSAVQLAIRSPGLNSVAIKSPGLNGGERVARTKRGDQVAELNAASLGRAATIVRQRRDVLDRADHDARR